VRGECHLRVPEPGNKLPVEGLKITLIAYRMVPENASLTSLTWHGILSRVPGQSWFYHTTATLRMSPRRVIVVFVFCPSALATTDSAYSTIIHSVLYLSYLSLSLPQCASYTQRHPEISPSPAIRQVSCLTGSLLGHDSPLIFSTPYPDHPSSRCLLNLLRPAYTVDVARMAGARVDDVVPLSRARERLAGRGK
jgi:hypothetical protein